MEPIKRIVHRHRREPTPLELLNRNHNWRMGQLRRLEVAVSILRHCDHQHIARNAILSEIQAEQQSFDAAKKDLIG